MIRFLLFLAAAGLLFSTALNVMALAGFGAYGHGKLLVVLLFGGLLIVWPALILFSFRIGFGESRTDQWHMSIQGAPAWMRRAAYGVFAYAMLSFIFFAREAPPKGMSAETPEGEILMLRAFSGHGMAFYAVAFTAFFSISRTPRLIRTRHCPEGHRISHRATFCKECGKAVPADLDVTTTPASLPS